MYLNRIRNHGSKRGEMRRAGQAGKRHNEAGEMEKRGQQHIGEFREPNNSASVRLSSTTQQNSYSLAEWRTCRAHDRDDDGCCPSASLHDRFPL
jgi:hypothetical protein